MTTLTTLHVIAGHQVQRKQGGWTFCADLMDNYLSFSAVSLQNWLLSMDPIFAGTAAEIQTSFDAGCNTLVIAVFHDHLEFDLVLAQPPEANAPGSMSLQ